MATHELSLTPKLNVHPELGNAGPGKKPRTEKHPGNRYTEKNPLRHGKKPNSSTEAKLEYSRKNLRVDLGGRILGLSHNSAEAQKK